MNAEDKVTELVQLQNSDADADTDVDGCRNGCRIVEVYQPTKTALGVKGINKLLEIFHTIYYTSVLYC